MGWTMYAALTTVLIHILNQETFAVTELKPATVKIFCEDQKKNHMRIWGIKINSSASCVM